MEYSVKAYLSRCNYLHPHCTLKTLSDFLKEFIKKFNDMAFSPYLTSEYLSSHGKFWKVNARNLFLDSFSFTVSGHI